MKNSTKGFLLCTLGLTTGYTSIFVARLFNFTIGESFVHEVITAFVMITLIVRGCYLMFNNSTK